MNTTNLKVSLHTHTAFDEFYDHVTQTGSQLEEIGGDLYALESMISLARDIEDLTLYQTHCYRLEATIYTLHEKIGSWQHSAKQRLTNTQRAEYNQLARELTQALSLVNDYIFQICSYEEKIMQLQQLINTQRAAFVATEKSIHTKSAIAEKAAIASEQEFGWA